MILQVGFVAISWPQSREDRKDLLPEHIFRAYPPPCPFCFQSRILLVPPSRCHQLATTRGPIEKPESPSVCLNGRRKKGRGEVKGEVLRWDTKGQGRRGRCDGRCCGCVSETDNFFCPRKCTRYVLVIFLPRRLGLSICQVNILPATRGDCHEALVLSQFPSSFSWGFPRLATSSLTLTL